MALFKNLDKLDILISLLVLTTLGIILYYIWGMWDENHQYKKLKIIYTVVSIVSADLISSILNLSIRKIFKIEK